MSCLWIYTLNVSWSEDGQAVEGQNGLYASAVYDETTKRYFVKVANTSRSAQTVTIAFTGIEALSKGQAITLHADDKAENSIATPDAVKPYTTSLPTIGNGVEATIGARTFAVIVVE